MSKPKDWTGHRFGRLTAIRNTFTKEITGNYLWEYKCDCGNTIIAKSGNVVSGHTKSCGCLLIEAITKHGMSKSNDKTYSSWRKMLCRAHHKYEEYAEYYKDVSVCERWTNEQFGFLNFLEDMGPRPEGMTLNRKNGSKEYNKQNCEWASYSVQTYDTCRHKNNKSGRTGVSWRERIKEYGSQQSDQKERQKTSTTAHPLKKPVLHVKKQNLNTTDSLRSEYAKTN